MRMISQNLLKNIIKRKFPKVDFKKLGPIGFGKKPKNENTIVSGSCVLKVVSVDISADYRSIYRPTIDR